jgi:multicomponent Na+:H+ antiporter subunit C
MTAPTIYGLCAAALVGVGLFGLVLDPAPLRKVIAFNIVGFGVFLFFGVAARRGEGAGLAADPTPQALVITGVVVAFAATALAVALIVRMAEAGRPDPDAPPEPPDDLSP